MREQIARYIEQDIPYIDWAWYLWHAYHGENEIEVEGILTAWGAYSVISKSFGHSLQQPFQNAA